MRCRFFILFLLFLSSCSFAPEQVAPTVRPEIVIASFYGQGDGFQGKTTASGERFDAQALTAAHRSLPFNTVVKVTSPATRRSVNVRINDRGPYVDGRTLDLSMAAAQQLGIQLMGVAPVMMEIVGRAQQGMEVQRARATQTPKPPEETVLNSPLKDSATPEIQAKHSELAPTPKKEVLPRAESAKALPSSVLPLNGLPPARTFPIATTAAPAAAVKK